MSIELHWKPQDFKNLVESCYRDTATPFILKYMPKNGKVLEAGCGLGRYLVYLSHRGFDVVGIELNQKAVDAVRTLSPKINIRHGDITQLEFENDSISGIISLGVVEHFISGPKIPLLEMLRVLKPGCYAIITVPSFNLVRKLKYYVHSHICSINPISVIKKSKTIRKLFGKEPVNKTGPHPLTYRSGVLPYKYKDTAQASSFFEYMFSPKEFHNELQQVGFTIVDSVPIAQMDGIYHDISKKIVPFKDWRFYPNLSARILNYILCIFPFCHNHMHLCIVRKDISSASYHS